MDAALNVQLIKIITSQLAVATKSDLDESVAELKYFVVKTVIGTGAGLFIALKASQYLGV